MLSPVNAQTPYAAAGPIAQQMRASLPPESAIGALADAASIEIGSGPQASPISNYGLPRDVIIARRAAAAAEVGLPDLGRKAGDQEPWMLSIAARYIGTYQTSGKAVSAAMNLTA